ncbi:hypothetical protein [Pseudomonas fitomaticsae]|uniref:Uncharacterized protein n=1 Tax=Pseudomonas fitomaticsae TaxID=2837969 RepID=A0ABY3QAS1_9PSED|nr:hypothetical protein [Pseudomonas fitomaticsae]UFQ03042.1 hypothetical protein KJY40_21315 [Pseudomonas fitomaticsae]
MKTETVPQAFHHPGICEWCQRIQLPPPTVEWRGARPPAPPPLRNPNASVTPSLGSLWIVLVFIVGVAVGAKMVGGW